MLYTVKEVAILLKVHPATITRALTNGDIKGIRPLNGKGKKGHWRIQEDQVQKLLGGAKCKK